MKNKKISNFCFTKVDFWLFFMLFMASVWSQKPGPTLVPGVSYELMKRMEKMTYLS